jgi:hypothetical protein
MDRRTLGSNEGTPRAPLTDFHFWATASVLDASLRLTAQEHHKSRALTRLRAQRFVRNDQGRSRGEIVSAMRSSVSWGIETRSSASLAPLRSPDCGFPRLSPRVG